MITRAHDMPFGAKVSEAGVTFRLWAPSAHTVDVIVDGAAPQPMSFFGGGWYGANGTDGPDGVSRVVYPHRFVWSDDQWRGRPWAEAVIYEVHIGAFTPEGTYAALTE